MFQCLTKSPIVDQTQESGDKAGLFCTQYISTKANLKKFSVGAFPPYWVKSGVKIVG